MANISAGMVKDLRDKTGAGMMDCKAALSETNGDMEAAIDWLRKKGISKAAKKSGRAAAEGLVDAIAPPPTPEIQGTPSHCIPYTRVEPKPSNPGKKED